MIIVFDYGHGGYNEQGQLDPGVTNGDLTEYELATVIGERARSKVEALGHTTVTTRMEPTAEMHSLMNRAAVANAAGADIFVSIHLNGFKDPAAVGTETYHHPNSSEGARLAQCVQDGLVANMGFPNRGVKAAEYGVLVYTDMPAVLAEVGFLSNPGEAAILASEEGQEAAAEGIVLGIRGYFGA
jgi:N-acetylmuramoyl-L-alanine amidase